MIAQFDLLIFFNDQVAIESSYITKNRNYNIHPGACL